MMDVFNFGVFVDLCYNGTSYLLQVLSVVCSTGKEKSMALEHKKDTEMSVQEFLELVDSDPDNRLEDNLELTSIGVHFPVAEIYEKTRFARQETE
jgi:hypothetical protein